MVCFEDVGARLVLPGFVEIEYISPVGGLVGAVGEFGEDAEAVAVRGTKIAMRDIIPESAACDAVFLEVVESFGDGTFGSLDGGMDVCGCDVEFDGVDILDGAVEVDGELGYLDVEFAGVGGVDVGESEREEVVCRVGVDVRACVFERSEDAFLELGRWDIFKVLHLEDDGRIRSPDEVGVAIVGEESIGEIDGGRVGWCVDDRAGLEESSEAFKRGKMCERGVGRFVVILEEVTPGGEVVASVGEEFGYIFGNVVGDALAERCGVDVVEELELLSDALDCFEMVVMGALEGHDCHEQGKGERV